MPTSNAAIIESSFSKFRERLMTEVENALIGIVVDLFQQLDADREWSQFTGNALGSLSCTIYRDGNATAFIDSKGITSAKNPISKKIQFGYGLHLSDPIEGDERTVKGETEEEKEYGYETARRVINQHGRVAPHRGVAALIAYGVRYVFFDLYGTISKEDLIRKIKSLYIQ